VDRLYSFINQTFN